MAQSDGFASWVGQMGNDLAGWAARLEPGELDPGCLMGVVAALEKAERLISVLKGRVAEDAVRRDAWRSSGARSAEAWYARVTGTSVGAARRRLATEARAAAQPEVDQARRKGELSDDQAERVSQAAGEDREAAAKLVERARRSTHRQLREECDRVAAARRRAEDEERRRRHLHAARSCRTWVDAEGAGRLDARGTPEAIAELRARMDPFVQGEFDRARREGRRESHDAYRFDALMAMAQAVTSDPGAHGANDPHEPGGGAAPDGGGPAPGGDPQPGGGPGGGAARQGRPARAPATVIAIVSHAALARGHVQDGETCQLDGIGPVPVSTVKELMGDAFLAAVVTDGTDIRSVAHLGRHPTARQSTALAVRDPCCVVPGCGSRDGLEVDHVTGWAATHTTTLDDLARLCRRHHRMKTYQGWTLTGSPGHWTFTPPDTGPDPPRAGPHPPAPGGQTPLFGPHERGAA